MKIELTTEEYVFICLIIVFFVIGILVGRASAVDNKLRVLLTLLDRDGDGKFDQEDVDYAVGMLMDAQKLEHDDLEQRMEDMFHKASCWKTVTAVAVLVWCGAAVALCALYGVSKLMIFIVVCAILPVVASCIHWVQFVRKEHQYHDLMEQREHYMQVLEQLKTADKEQA
eukprot:gnl/MRDRNA2_/MRDRNA2_30150_c0_seq1.p1 gnl/MRDRNA2_/MRDRNA2_30150_c0~~gnl/MRDRNA2_/MRDRNA2_30150_c0_seq1.p1  ORF type:complete len:170 (+),score=36.63 gnl/MRDRNA2_/MRDRNA2_30150_c0_seq1:84-593(+)